jgi:hypothetical protein
VVQAFAKAAHSVASVPISSRKCSIVIPKRPCGGMSARRGGAYLQKVALQWHMSSCRWRNRCCVESHEQRSVPATIHFAVLESRRRRGDCWLRLGAIHVNGMVVRFFGAARESFLPRPQKPRS